MNNDENRQDQREWRSEENYTLSAQKKNVGVVIASEYDGEQIKKLFEQFSSEFSQLKRNRKQQENTISTILNFRRFNTFGFFILFAACGICCSVTWRWHSSYLQTTVDTILKAKGNNCHGCLTQKPIDCFNILQLGHSRSGVYIVWPMVKRQEKPVKVYCDMDTDGGGWTVFQRRGNFQSSKDYFFKNWTEYKNGFGDIKRDFWLGNDNLFALTNQRLYSVRFDLRDFEQNQRYAHYEEFWIDGEINRYTLHVSGYSGDAGDSMLYSNGEMFTTKEQTNGPAVKYKGAWWYWSGPSLHSNLNGLYYEENSRTIGDGIHWDGNTKTLKWAEIKIRPEYFRPAYTPDALPA